MIIINIIYCALVRELTERQGERMGRVLDEIKTAHLSSSRLNELINEWVLSARDSK